MNTTHRHEARNAKIVKEYQAGATISELMFKYDLRKSRIYTLIKPII